MLSLSFFISLSQACHTGMRSYIYNKNSLVGSQAEHCGMRTYFFSADTQEDMNGWIRAMNQAALMQSHGAKRSVHSSCYTYRQKISTSLISVDVVMSEGKNNIIQLNHSLIHFTPLTIHSNL